MKERQRHKKQNEDEMIKVNNLIISKFDENNQKIFEENKFRMSAYSKNFDIFFLNIHLYIVFFFRKNFCSVLEKNLFSTFLKNIKRLKSNKILKKFKIKKIIF